MLRCHKNEHDTTAKAWSVQTEGATSEDSVAGGYGASGNPWAYSFHYNCIFWGIEGATSPSLSVFALWRSEVCSQLWSMSLWLRLAASQHLYHSLVRLSYYPHLPHGFGDWSYTEKNQNPNLAWSILKHPGCLLHCLTALYLWKLRAQGQTVKAGTMRALMSGWASGSRLHSCTEKRKTSNYDIKICVTEHDTFHFFLSKPCFFCFAYPTSLFPLSKQSKTWFSQSPAFCRWALVLAWLNRVLVYNR